MKFIKVARKEPRPAAQAGEILFFLLVDNWNDFSNVVTFHLFYADYNDEEKRIGELKILQKSEEGVNSKTEIPNEFDGLSESYISLGQSDDYYTSLFGLGKEVAEQVLLSLRDISWIPSLAGPFEPSRQFQKALMRFPQSFRCRRLGAKLARGETPNESYSFLYECDLNVGEPPVVVDLNFDAKDPAPNRICALIGRNAVGKTRLLNRMAEDLAILDDSSEEVYAAREARFLSGRPLFARVLAVSYSAFDNFKRPNQDGRSSYVYCGIRDDEGHISREALLESYRTNKERIKNQDRVIEWVGYIQQIMDNHSASLRRKLENEAWKGGGSDELERLSSGQAILWHFITSMVAWIQHDSLVLFDEPETHLHPNAVASLFSVMSSLLVDFRSYAILGTHSPIVIQEVPARRVIVLKRQNGYTFSERLGIESFGESISELTRHVFDTGGEDVHYKDVLQKLARNRSFDEVMQIFEGNLSMNAQAYLLSACTKRGGK